MFISLTDKLGKCHHDKSNKQTHMQKKGTGHVVNPYDNPQDGYNNPVLSKIPIGSSLLLQSCPEILERLSVGLLCDCIVVFTRNTKDQGEGKMTSTEGHNTR
jgi:hypothetical protein